MENNQIIETYFAEKDRREQLNLPKDYMLSLSSDKLKKFMMEPLSFLEEALNSSTVSDERKNGFLVIEVKRHFKTAKS